MEKILPVLSRRECSIIAYMAEGYTNEQIGKKHGLSEKDIQKHLQNMMQKKGFFHSYQLISWAYLQGILK